MSSVAIATGGVIPADVRAAQSGSFTDPTQTRPILFRWEVSLRLATCREVDRTLTDDFAKQETTHEHTIPT